MPISVTTTPFGLSFSIEISSSSLSFSPNILTVLLFCQFIFIICSVIHSSLQSDVYNVILKHTIDPFYHLIHLSFILILFYLFIRFLIDYFLEVLTANEQAMINDQLFMFLTDTMLIISIFSDEISLSNFSLFFILIMMKCLTWLVSERVTRQKDTKIRIFIGLILIPTILCFMNNILLSLSAKSFYILFSFEYAIIILLLLRSLILTFLTDPFSIIITDISYIFLKLSSLVTFFIYTTIHYRIPFNVFRESVSTLRVLMKKVNDYLSYRRILQVIDSCEGTNEGECPICAEEFIPTEEDVLEEKPVHDTKEAAIEKLFANENKEKREKKEKDSKKNHLEEKYFKEEKKLKDSEENDIENLNKKEIEDFEEKDVEDPQDEKNLQQKESEEQDSEVKKVEDCKDSKYVKDLKEKFLKEMNDPKYREILEEITEKTVRRGETEESKDEEVAEEKKGEKKEQPEEKMRGIRLPCTHVFHADCLKRWVESQQLCPVCRATIGSRGSVAARTASVQNIMESVPIQEE